MVRTRTFDPDDALEKAMGVFWEKGFQHTSIEDLVEASGVSRYGWYGTFGNKDDIYRAALKFYLERFMGHFTQDLDKADAGRAELEGYFQGHFDLVESGFHQKGCMACDAANELARHDQELADYLAEMHRGHRQQFENAIRNGQANGEIRTDIPAETLAMTVYTLEQGIATLHSRGYSVDDLRKCMEALNTLLD